MAAGEEEESMNHRLISVAALITVAAMALQAQKHPAQSAAVSGPPAPTAKFVASTEKTFDQLMRDAMDVMHKGMHSAPYTSDPDRDFVTMMIPHHQGAIDMAKTLLLYGKDPQMRRLAQEIITDQESEIQLMRLWLKNSQNPTQRPGLDARKH
jgi:uncharacterized protein (DUF305 family)